MADLNNAMKKRFVKANTRTTLAIDADYLPIRIITAREAFTALMRHNLRFFDGSRFISTPYVVLDKDLEQYDGQAWLEGRDVFIAEDYPLIRTGNHVYPVPTIMKVRNFHKKPSDLPRIRNKKPSFGELLRKHDFTCALTGVRYDPSEHDPYEVFNRDHIIPRSKGGPDTEENIVLAARVANEAKADTWPYRLDDGEELKAILQHEFFPKLNLKGVQYRSEWSPLLFTN